MTGEVELAGHQNGQAIEPWQQLQPTNLPRAAAALVEWARAASAANALAQSLCKTNFVPAAFRGKPDEATACILAGAEVGLSPMAALAGFDMISGTAYPKAMTLRAVLQAQGHEIVIDQSTPTVAKGRARRAGSTEWQSAEWTIARARQAGLIGKSVPAKDNWIKQPTAMLVARLTSELSRLVAADALLGIAYSSEEIADGMGAPVAPVTSPRQRVSVAGRAQDMPDLANVGQAAGAPAGADVAGAVTSEPAPAGGDDPPTEPPAAPPEPLQMITGPQQRKLHLLLNRRKFDRDSGLTYASETIQRPIESTAELTVAEASAVIEALQRSDPDEPPLDEPPPDRPGMNEGQAAP